MQLTFQQNNLNFFGLVNFYIMERYELIYNMSQYSTLAAKRYREHIWRKQKESWIQGLLTVVLHIWHGLIRMLQQTRIKKARRVEKINVE
ncbi:MAG: hypothetical protein M3218_04795 [Thermoproteota archaeon]|nr:hypothetical protein [Thermoproteota archaeon]